MYYTTLFNEISKQVGFHIGSNTSISDTASWSSESSSYFWTQIAVTADVHRENIPKGATITRKNEHQATISSTHQLNGVQPEPICREEESDSDGVAIDKTSCDSFTAEREVLRN